RAPGGQVVPPREEPLPREEQAVGGAGLEQLVPLFPHAGEGRGIADALDDRLVVAPREARSRHQPALHRAASSRTPGRPIRPGSAPRRRMRPVHSRALRHSSGVGTRRAATIPRYASANTTVVTASAASAGAPATRAWTPAVTTPASAAAIASLPTSASIRRSRRETWSARPRITASTARSAAVITTITAM